MGCCSGSAQTKRGVVTIKFRCVMDLEFTITIPVAGKDGEWSGRANTTFDFGNGIGCGRRMPSGLQEIRFSADLTCAEHATGATVRMDFQFTVGKYTHRGILAAVKLGCEGGPECRAEWPDVFLGPVIGSANVLFEGT